MKKISVIIPTLNESAVIERTLAALQPLRSTGHEIIVVDGGSNDDTVLIAKKHGVSVKLAPRGRAPQMNSGALAAAGNVLLFLHADTLLPLYADKLIFAALHQHRDWGRFDVRLSGTQPLLRIIEKLINWRSRWSGIATGDQAIFVRRKLFEASGGFPLIELMEDIAFSTRLKRHGLPACISIPVITSSRRWEKTGIIKTILLMWSLRLAYALGVKPHRLAKAYR